MKPGAPKLPAIVGEVADGEVHVKTSGLTFDQKSGVATTAQRVDFALKQGSGSSVGATFDSGKGYLVLDRSVELHVSRGGPGLAQPVTLHAVHAEFERKEQICHLTQAQAEYSGGTAQAGLALVHFRDDGSIIRLDGSSGVALATETGNHLAAPRGTLEFDEENHPRRGVMEGGAKFDSAAAGRQMHGAAPTVRMTFDGAGQLRLAHLEQGVQFESEQAATAKNAGTVKRTWHSQTADIEFATAAGAPKVVAGAQSGKTLGKVEARTIRGFGGVVITSDAVGDTSSGASKLAADTVVAELAPGGNLSRLTGTGHANFDQRTATGAHQASSSDQLEIRMTVPAGGKTKASNAGSEIASVVQIGQCGVGAGWGCCEGGSPCAGWITRHGRPRGL